MDLFNLIAKITLDDKDYKKGINSAEKSGKSFGSSLTKGLKVAGKAMAALYTGTVAVASAIAKVTINTADYLGEIDDEAQKLNMSTAAYQKWSQAIKMSGSDISTLSMGMKTFTGILDNASNGNAEALLTLQKLGLGYEDFEGLSVEDSFKKVVEQFQGMEQGAKKTQLAVDIFGRSGQELLPLFNQEVGWLDKMFTSYENLGFIISDDVIKAGAEFGDQLDLLKQKLKIVGVNIGTIFMPAISKVVTGLLDLARGSAGAGETLKSGIIGAINAVIDYLPKIGEFAAMIIPLIVDTVVSTLPKLLQAAIDIVVTLADMLIEYLPDLIPAAIGMILTLVQGLLNNLPMLIDTAIDLILAIVDGLIASLPIIIEMAPEIIEALINGLVYAIPKLWEVAIDIGKNMINGIITGVKNAIPTMIDTLKNAGRNALDAIKGFLGIKSPSRLFRDEVGKYIPQGIAVGVENEMPETADRIKKSIKDNTDVDDMVNGFNTVSRMRANNSQPIQLTVPVYVGNEELKTYTYKAVDSGMKQRGLRDLKTTGGYNT